MEIIRAERSGFCFGVKKAVDTAFRQLEENPAGSPLFTHGQLIHNRDVTDELESRGIQAIDRLEEVPEGATVIVRSHGETKQF